MTIKTDNRHVGVKLELRRHILRRYQSVGGFRVFDACQGSGVLWSRLREEFTVASYWGVDMKRKMGRLSVDSARVLAQPGWAFDVVDIDTYGMPWNHYRGVWRNMGQTCIVMLTIGVGRTGKGNDIGTCAKQAAGIVFSRPVPKLLPGALLPLVTEYALFECQRHGVIVAYRAEATHPDGGSARYIAVRLERVK